jgi:hypothetical protein
MSISAGTYTVGGPGTNYPGTSGLNDAINDIPAGGLTGNLAFTIHGNVSWSVNIAKKFNGYAITITSAEYHDGDITKGYTITTSGTSVKVYSTVGGGATAILHGLNITGSRIEFGDTVLGYPIAAQFYNNVMRSMTSNDGLYFYAAASLKMYACKLYLAKATFVGGNKVVDNITVYNSGVTGSGGFVLSGDMSTSSFKNCIIVSSGTEYTASTLSNKPLGNNNFCNNAMSDVWSVSSSGNTGGVVAANEFKSVVASHVDFLKLKDNSIVTLAKGGVAPSSYVEEDIAGLSIQYDDGTYPVGCHRSVNFVRETPVASIFAALKDKAYLIGQKASDDTGVKRIILTDFMAARDNNGNKSYVDTLVQ